MSRNRVRSVGFLDPIPANPNNYSKDDYGQTFLSALYSSPKWQNYAVYFLIPSIRYQGVFDNHADIEFVKIAGIGLGKAGAPCPVQLYGKSCTLLVQEMASLVDADAFHITNVDHAVFLNLDSFGSALVPFDSAKLISQCFVKGLVTRLVLENYNESWSAIPGFANPILNFDSLKPKAPGQKPFKNKVDARLTSAPGSVAPNAAVDDWIQTNIAQFVQQVASPGTWKFVPNQNIKSYADCISNATPASTQAAAILHGWRAGDKLTSATASPDDKAALATIWKLIGYRYNHESLGKMMGYVAMFLNGFLKNENIVNVINTGKLGAPIINNQTGVFNAYASSRNGTLNNYINFEDPIDNLAARISRLISAELICIAQRGDQGSAATKYALKSSLWFLKGYTQGVTSAADSLFTQFFQMGISDGMKEGYSIGYSDGFRDGYSQGYASGWESGYNNALNAQAASGGLNSIVSDVGTVLGDIGGIVSSPVVGTVLGAIGALF